MFSANLSRWRRLMQRNSQLTPIFCWTVFEPDIAKMLFMPRGGAELFSLI